MLRTFATLCWTVCLALSAQAETLRLAVTPSFVDSGIAPILLPAFEAATGHAVHITLAEADDLGGLASAGHIDVAVADQPARLAALVSEGIGTQTHPVMSGRYVLVGPDADPTRARRQSTIVNVFHGVVLTGSPFLSARHSDAVIAAETAIWAATGVNKSAFGNWYRLSDRPLQETLALTSQERGYSLVDHAGWLMSGGADGLAVLVENDPALQQDYHVMTLRNASEAATTFQKWITGPAAKQLIADYRIAGEQVFHPAVTAQ